MTKGRIPAIKNGGWVRTSELCSGTTPHVNRCGKEVHSMDKRAWLDRETFFRIAEGAGLKTGDPHLDELYRYVRDVLPGLRGIDELDLKDVEPMSSPGSYGGTGRSPSRQGG
jgi:hypothetical protein